MSTTIPPTTHETDAAHGGFADSRPHPSVPMTLPRVGGMMNPVGANSSPLRGATGSSFDIFALLKALKRRWVLAMTLGLVLGGLVGGVAWNVVPSSKYTATAVIQVMQYKPRVMFVGQEREAEFAVFQKTQIALLTSNKVLKAALRDPQVVQLPTLREQPEIEDLPTWMSEQIKVNFNDKSEILQVSMSGDRPADLATLVNAVVDAYMANVVEEDRNARMERLEKLRKLWDGYQVDLKAKRQSLNALAQSAGSTDRETLAYIHQSTHDSIHRAKARLESYREQIRQLTIDLKVMEGVKGEVTQTSNEDRLIDQDAIETAVDHALENDPNLNRWKEELQTLNVRLAKTQGVARIGSDPAILALKQQRLGLVRKIGDYEAKQRPSLQMKAMEGAMTGVGGNPNAPTAAHVRVRLALLNDFAKEASAEIEQLEKRALQQNINTLDVTQENEEIQVATETARKVAHEIETIEVELQAPERVVVINRADLPRKKDEMKRLRTIGMAVAAAFGLGLIGVGFWEFRARRISSVDEVVNTIGLNIVGSLPAMPDRPRRKLNGPSGQTMEQRWQKLLVESVDAMRTMLLHASRVEALRVVMVTSAGQGEGKTSLASHLATSLARAGRKTLLVDCDIRRPTIHRLFDEPLDLGLCELLRGEVSALDAVRQGPSPELSLVTAGRYDELAQQFLGQDRVRDIFEEWKQHFEFIVIDTAPVLPVADSLFLSQHVDGVLFAILRQVSRVPQVQAAYDRLARLGARMLGAVVNGAESNAFHDDSHYYYARQAETPSE